MLDILRNFGWGKIFAAALLLFAIVVVYVGIGLRQPPQRDVRIDPGTDSPDLFVMPPPPAVPAAPTLEPARLVPSEQALFVQGRQGEGPVVVEFALANRGQRRASVQSQSIEGDTAFALASACTEIEPGGSCQARVLMSTTLAGNFRARLTLRYTSVATGSGNPEQAPSEELAISLGGEVVQRLVVLPDLHPFVPEIPRDYAAERAESQRRDRAAASPGIVAGRVPGGDTDRGEAALIRRQSQDRSNADAASRQNGYGDGFARRQASLPVDRTRVITADRYIEATLATSINSRIPGEVRAIVARNVMGTDGRLVLIPARSSLIGRFEGMLATGSGARPVRPGDSRLAIRWTRIIRPDGAHVVIDDQGYDAMGRTGLIGEVDNRMFEKFFGAALVTTLQIGAAIAQGAIDSASTTYQVVNQGGTSILVPQNAGGLLSGLRDGGKTGVDRMSAFVEQMLRDGMTLEPIITIPQGTMMFVVPREDIWFPDAGRNLEQPLARIVAPRSPSLPGPQIFGPPVP
jgi:type IV secretory pathway VirB10-like protein